MRSKVVHQEKLQVSRFQYDGGVRLLAACVVQVQQCAAKLFFVWVQKTVPHGSRVCYTDSML